MAQIKLHMLDFRIPKPSCAWINNGLYQLPGHFIIIILKITKKTGSESDILVNCELFLSACDKKTHRQHRRYLQASSKNDIHNICLDYSGMGFVHRMLQLPQ